MNNSSSIITKYEKLSAFSNEPAEVRHHCLFGRGIRELAEQDGVWIPLLNREHNLSPKGTIYQIHGNPAAEKLSKMVGQLAWEKHYIAEKYSVPFDDIENEAREAFRERYGVSYL